MPIQRKVPVAKVGEITSGRTKTFRFGTHQGIVYNDQGTLKAFVNKCTHMGGPVEGKVVQGRFVFQCRWHEARFEPATGAVIEGQAPAGSRLTPIVLAEEGGYIVAVLDLPDDPFSF